MFLGILGWVCPVCRACALCQTVKCVNMGSKLVENVDKYARKMSSQSVCP